MSENYMKPDYIFEVSWEVCNKIGGIHTVISTKALELTKQFNDHYICVGPDVWKETHLNPEFIEDKYLYRSWRKQAAKAGLHIRIGRWNIPGEPIAFLVDFTPLFSQKDNIFTDLWLKFGLNSLSGQWDYTEPAMFGYAAAQVIENFYEFHISARDKLVTHFHEWMTGSGVLYLNDKLPQAATIFTTHATTLGRSIAGHGMKLYSRLNEINPEEKAEELGVVSKNSMEKTAAKFCDAFATVSDITAKECEKLIGKVPDVVTPNGFDNAFLPKAEDFSKSRVKSRENLLNLAKGLINQDIPDNALLIATSGRYEFKNKGIDLLIDALGRLNKYDLPNNIVAFIFIPANQTGIRPEVIERVKNPDFSNPISNEYSTHKLVDDNSDPILFRLKKAGLRNKPEDKVKVVFFPAYLDGKDGALNLDYYSALIGLDLSAFPSYYEPWGYTPLESLAFKVPTITTSLAGFGLWARENFPDAGKAVSVIERNDDNDEDVIDNMVNFIFNCVGEEDAGNMVKESEGDEKESIHKNLLEARNKSTEIAGAALWDNLIDNYYKAYDIALQKVLLRADQYKDKKLPIRSTEVYKIPGIKPKWKKIRIETHIPDDFADLQKLAQNLWWTWNNEAEELFKMIDPDLWETHQKNPLVMLDNLSVNHYDVIRKDKDFTKKYKEVIADFKEYLKKGENKKPGTIAYLSMEYGLHSTVKIYSGGLGVLAGDYLKQASDDNINLVGIGLLYRYGYFTQNLSVQGEQTASYFPHNFSHMSAVPVRDENNNWIKISIAFPGRTLHAKVWKIDVGRIPLYLMDTDIPENNSADRFITHQLYGGDWENRFKQEFLLGIGGIRLLDALNISPEVFHCNEGHASFAGLERLRKLVQEQKLSFYEAKEVVRSSSLFTTHTPVPAGHDFFSEDMLRTYMPHYADRLGISWEAFMGLGKMDPTNVNEDFSMSVLATKLSQEVNGVSKIHGKVSREMFKDTFPGYFSEELHITHVTNGVHYGTWTAKEWKELYKKTFGDEFLENISNPEHWKKIHQLDDEIIWNLLNLQRKKLKEFLKQRLKSSLGDKSTKPKKVYQLIEALNDEVLTVGFARRFATYKRAHLIFNDLDRLSKLVNNPDMPVQFIYAGKAHPADKAGQDLIKHIVEISKKPEFMGKIVFLEDYDMELGAELVKGVDIWLNTPTRPLEASGTSGQKAALNGVMNFSVLDGWWAEGYKPDAGWAIKEEKTYDNQDFQNELDAEMIYSTFENEIIPLFYKRNKQNIPVDWVKCVKNNIAQIAPQFTNKRMLDDYIKQHYTPLLERSKMIKENDFKKAREFSSWKNQIVRDWEHIEVISKDIMNTSDKSLLLGENFHAKITLDLNEIFPEDIGVEVVFTEDKFNDAELVLVEEMKQINVDNTTVTYECQVPANKAGVFNYGFRVFPKHPLMAHRQDFNLVRWI
ncbi:MAG: alpha-glucan family phosphorylase [Bacteroidota bacterium]